VNLDIKPKNIFVGGYSTFDTRIYMDLGASIVLNPHDEDKDLPRYLVSFAT
jgi:hypothetical protein